MQGEEFSEDQACCKTSDGSYSIPVAGTIHPIQWLIANVNWIDYLIEPGLHTRQIVRSASQLRRILHSTSHENITPVLFLWSGTSLAVCPRQPSICARKTCAQVGRCLPNIRISSALDTWATHCDSFPMPIISKVCWHDGVKTRRCLHHSERKCGWPQRIVAQTGQVKIETSVAPALQNFSKSCDLPRSRADTDHAWATEFPDHNLAITFDSDYVSWHEISLLVCLNYCKLMSSHCAPICHGNIRFQNYTIVSRHWCSTVAEPSASMDKMTFLKSKTKNVVDSNDWVCCWIMRSDLCITHAASMV